MAVWRALILALLAAVKPGASSLYVLDSHAVERTCTRIGWAQRAEAVGTKSCPNFLRLRVPGLCVVAERDGSTLPTLAAARDFDDPDLW